MHRAYGVVRRRAPIGPMGWFRVGLGATSQCMYGHVSADMRKRNIFLRASSLAFPFRSATIKLTDGEVAVRFANSG